MLTWPFRTRRQTLPWRVLKGTTMSKIDELKADIERLPSEEMAELYRWLSKKDWEGWDRELEADAQAGKLDFLAKEAREEKAKGILKEI
jgi:hypothetical protein